MFKLAKQTAAVLGPLAFLLAVSCGGAKVERTSAAIEPDAAPSAVPVAHGFQPPAADSGIPNLQAEILDDRGKTTASPLGSFDFRNFTYPLPRSWQHQDGDEIVLQNGKLTPKFKDIQEEMTPEEKAAARAERRIGMSYVTAKYLDVNGDGQDEAAVVLKVETGGNAIPQLVYIYEWKNGQPNLLWNFRTGDRADGGLKDIRAENGGMVVELYGQDRFLLGQFETAKITGDEEQLCCPTFFTRTYYKWNGKVFQMQGKRLTYEMSNPANPPLENWGDIMNDPVKSKKYLKG